MKKQVALFFLFSFLAVVSFAQNSKKRVLFIGNSYTSRNDLPLIISNIAATRGDTLLFDMNAPSGYTFLLHAKNANTLSKIVAGNWDFVVLQEHSQRPALTQSEVDSKFFPNAKVLDSLINVSSPCGETMFYMTWGRKNGDTENCGALPIVCTYEGMDSMLQVRYMMATDSNKAVVSPVGAVWRHIRQNDPVIELYNADESHPSVAGSYAAACCFYTLLFRQNPINITYNHGLTKTEANHIKAAVKAVVFDSLLNWRIGTYDPKANFKFSTGTNNKVTFTNRSLNATTYLWDFGDGNASTDINPTHTYTQSGTYSVKLTVFQCNMSSSISFWINLSTTAIASLRQESDILIYPNPVIDNLTIASSKVDEIFIVDAIGRKQTPVYKMTADKTTVNLSTITSGIYFIILVNDGKVSTRKVIKQ